MRFLCLSDIHGHLLALDAVLSEAQHLGWDQMVVCGDLCFPGPDPLGVWKRLIEHKALCTQGVGDRALARVDPNKLSATTESERERIEWLRKTHQMLGEVIVTRLGRLPPFARLPIESGHTMLVVHGSPTEPTEPLSAEMDDDEMSQLLGDDCGDLVICGGSHVPFDRSIGDVRILNVGSVGEAPSGEYAHAAIVETTALGIAIHPLNVRLGE